MITLLTGCVLLITCTLSVMSKNPGHIHHDQAEKTMPSAENISFQGITGPELGRLASFVFDPVNEGVAYAANAEGRQLLKTTDAGTSWEYLFATPKVSCDRLSPRIYDLRFPDPNEPAHLYFNVKSITMEDMETSGLYLLDTSTGQLLHTIQIETEAMLDFADYDVNAADPNHLVVYSVMGFDYPGSRKTVWRSADNGENFEMIFDYEDYEMHAPEFVRFHPSDPDILYLGMKSNWSGPSGGLYRSTDGGKTWNLKEEGIPFADIAFLPGNDEKMYAVSGEGAAERQLFVSHDAGETWSEVEMDIELTTGWQDYFLQIHVNQNDSDKIWITHTDNILSSTDGGETWHSSYFINDSFIYALGHQIAIDPFDNDHLVISNALFPMKTTDHGENWEPLSNKMVALTSFDAVSFEDGSSYLYYTIQNSYFVHDLHADSIGGEVDLSPWGENYYIFGDQHTPNRVFLAKPGGFIGGITLYRSDDNFETAPENVFSSDNSILNAIVRAPDDEDTYWLIAPEYNPQANTTLYRTTDGFVSTEELSVTGAPERITALEAVEGEEGVLYASVDSPAFKGVFKSTNYGSNWMPSSNGMPNDIFVSDIAIDQNNPALIAAATSEGIYLSSDGGANWEQSLDTEAFTSIVCSKKHPGLIMALADDAPGIVYSPDAGGTWFSLPEELFFDVDFGSMNIIEQEDDLIDIYISTVGMGVIVYRLSIVHTYNLTFHVQCETGAELENASITLDGVEYNPGTHSFDELPNGAYNYLIVKEGYKDVEGTAHIADADKEVDITMKKLRYSLTFTIQCETGEDIPDAVITLDGVAYDPGVHSFDDLTNGEYNYLISKDGYKDMEGTAHIADADKEAVVTMEKLRYSLTFVIQCETGEDIPDAVITLEDNEFDVGQHEIGDLLPGSFDYTVAAEGYNKEEGTVTITDHDKEVLVTMEQTETVDAPDPGKIQTTVFPVPASHVVHIRTTGMVERSLLFNSAGQMIHETGEQGNAFSIDVSSLDAGMYVLHLYTEHGMVTKRLIVN